MSTTEINIDQKENRESEKSDTVFLSLHQAAKMTGYHQDYLGQMARSGKLEARKVGRNWQTTKLAIDKMLGRVPKEDEVVSAPEKVSEPVVVQSVEEVKNPVAEPVVVVASQQEVVPQVETSLSNKSVLGPKIKINLHRVKEIVLEETVASEVEVERELASIESTARMHEVLNRRISIRRLINSPDAGPNLQEALAFAVAAKPSPVAIRGTENKNIFHRLNKLSHGKVLKTATEAQPEKYKRAKKLSDEILSDQNSKWSTRAVVFAACVMLAAVGYFSWTVLNSTPQSNSLAVVDAASNFTTEAAPEKMVAGESTTSSQLKLNQGPGQGTVFAGKDEVVVNHPGAEVDSIIMVTFRGDYGGRYWVSDQRAGQFTVKLSSIATQDTKFDYWVIDKEQRDPP